MRKWLTVLVSALSVVFVLGTAPHLVPTVERLTDDHRECLADVTSTYWLRAYFDGRLSRTSFDLSAVLAQCPRPPASA